MTIFCKIKTKNYGRSRIRQIFMDPDPQHWSEQTQSPTSIKMQPIVPYGAGLLVSQLFWNCASTWIWHQQEISWELFHSSRGDSRHTSIRTCTIPPVPMRSVFMPLAQQKPTNYILLTFFYTLTDITIASDSDKDQRWNISNFAWNFYFRRKIMSYVQLFFAFLF